MYNEIEHDLTTLDMPNIIFVDNKGHSSAVTLHPFMRPLIIRLAKARPNWTLYGIAAIKSTEDATKRLAATFVIYHGGEELGTLTRRYDYSRCHDTFCINNKRMANKRQRGDTTTTKDVNKAFKIITKEFYGKTTDELVSEADSRINNTLSMAVGGVRSRYNMQEYATRPHMLSFALANWDAFASHAVANGLDHSTADTFLDNKREYEDANRMHDARGKRGTTVVLRGSDYIMTCGDVTTVMSHDQLTPHMRRCIGLLKLAEVDTCIPNVGAKSTPDIMFIMPEPEGAEPNE